MSTEPPEVPQLCSHTVFCLNWLPLAAVVVMSMPTWISPLCGLAPVTTSEYVSVCTVDPSNVPCAVAGAMVPPVGLMPVNETSNVWVPLSKPDHWIWIGQERCGSLASVGGIPAEPSFTVPLLPAALATPASPVTAAATNSAPAAMRAVIRTFLDRRRDRPDIASTPRAPMGSAQMITVRVDPTTRQPSSTGTEPDAIQVGPKG